MSVTCAVQARANMVSKATAQSGGCSKRSDDIASRHTPQSITSSGVVACSLLNRCRLVAPLGRGGMAEVFLAACEVTPTERYPVAVKRLYAHFGDGPSALQMLHDEARVVANLSHQNIVKQYEIGVLDHHHCLVMEYLEGQSLQRLMLCRGQRTGFSVDVAVYIILQILDALEYAHNAKDRNNAPLSIIHRDISPQNVFITNDGCVKLLDFGIAKAGCQEGRTVTGLVKGKFAYIAPEQAMGQPIDGRSDLWSVGVVLWELLSGRRLFKADNEAATLRATLRADVPRLVTVRPDIPLELERIVGRALQRHTSQRYSSATEMKHDLSRYLRHSASSPDASVLSALMQSMFPAEIAEQQLLLASVMTSEHSLPTTPYNAFQTTETPVSQTSDTLDVLCGAKPRTWNHLGSFYRFPRRTWIFGLAVATTATLVTSLVINALPNVQNNTLPNVQNNPPTQPLVRKAAGTSVPVHSIDVSPQMTNAVLPPSTPDHSLPKTTGSSARKSARTAEKRSAQASSITPSPTEPTVGYLTLDTTPWSLVRFKERLIGQTPIIRTKLPVGTHILVLSNPDLGIETSYSVNITEGAITTKRIGLE